MTNRHAPRRARPTHAAHSRPRFNLAIALGLMLTLAACGDDPAGPPVAGSEPADMTAYLATKQSWASFAPLREDAEVALGDPTHSLEDVDGTEYHCSSVDRSITRTPDKIVTFNPDSEILWPGVLLQGAGHLQGIGGMAELPIRQRAPLTLAIDLLNADNTRTVQDPALGTVNQAIGELVERAQQQGHTAGSSISYGQELSYSSRQSAVKMGLSASYMGADVEAKLEASVSAEKRTVMCHFVQRMFTVSVQLPQTPSDFFTDEMTQAVLQQQEDLGRIGDDNLPIFVSNVVYGRILTYTFTSSASESKINAVLNIVASSADGSPEGELSVEEREILQNAEIGVVTVGGDAEHALGLIRTGDLSEYFRGDAPLTTARPLSYTVRSLADNAIARVSETVDYTQRRCGAQPTGAEYRFTFRRIETGDDMACDPVVSFPDNLEAEVFYTFRVTDGRDEHVAVEWTPTLAHPYADKLRANETHTLVTASGASPQPVTVRLYFDAPQGLVLYGRVYDYDALTTADLIGRFDRTWTDPITPGSFIWTAAQSNGVQIKLHYQVEKLDDLYD